MKECRRLHLRPEDPGEPHTPEEAAAHRDRALAWLGDPPEAPQRSAAWHRVPAQRMSLAVDHAMVMGLGKGIGNFIEEAGGAQGASEIAEADRKGQRHPTLIVSCDQCSLNTCLLWYLQFHMKAHVFVVTDFSHRLWNNCRPAVVDMQWWSTLVLSTFLQNIYHGP